MSPARKARPVILAALPGTQATIREQTGLSYTTVRGNLIKMMADGEIHITGWKRHGKAFIPEYTSGPGVNVKCNLKRRTPMENWHRWRKRQGQTGDYEITLAVKRARRWADRAAAHGDTFALANAFFGRQQKASNGI